MLSQVTYSAFGLLSGDVRVGIIECKRENSKGLRYCGKRALLTLCFNSSSQLTTTCNSFGPVWVSASLT